MEIFDLPPMLKGNEQDLPNLRNYLIRLGDEIKRITNDLSAIESIEKIVAKTETAIKFTEESLNTKQNKLTFDEKPEAGSTNPVTSEGIYQSFLDSIYPVGSIYMSVLSTSPAVFLGGTWERIKDTFLLAAGTTYTAGATGGEATHTLTVNEMPAHRHKPFDPFPTQDGNWFGLASSSSTGAGWSLANGSQNNKLFANHPDTGSAGGGEAHNNMPPYLAVYVWKRIA